jgi:hypothetical protein
MGAQVARHKRDAMPAASPPVSSSEIPQWADHLGLRSSGRGIVAGQARLDRAPAGHAETSNFTARELRGLMAPMPTKVGML